MRILVFGAGVIGCNLARNLFRAGKDVTLLARGAWAEEIQKNGLRIKDKFSPRMSVTRIPVVTELKPEARVRIQMAFIIHKSPHLWWELLCMAESEGFEPSKYSSIPTENTTFLKFVSNFVSKYAL